MPQNILILETNRLEVETLRNMLEKRDYDVTSAYGVNEAKQRLRDKVFHFIIFGTKIVAEIGQNVIISLHREAPGIAGLVLVNSPPQADIIEASRQCGYRHLETPFSTSRLLEIVDQSSRVREEPSDFSRNKKNETPEILGNSSAIHRLQEALLAVAQTDATTLLHGETGTGKELAARFIHSKSSRAGGRFVAINCSALTESLLESELFGHEKGSFTGAHKQKLGKFEYAGRGTLLLDEIGEMSPHLQTKMLRVIDDREFERVGGNQTHSVECRIISASNIDFPKALREGRFREDLYHRLNVVSIEIPPLRQRREDIPLLARHFLARYTAKYNKPATAFAPAALEQLNNYSWPGNIRELENIIERSVILNTGNILERMPLPAGDGVHTAPSLSVWENMEHLTLKELQKKVLGECEKTYLIQLLQKHSGHISRTAIAADIDRKTFYRKIHEYGIDPAHYKKKKSLSKKST